MQAVLFVLYAAVLSFIITRSGFLVKSGLPKTVLAALFLLYGFVGCAHLLIAYHFFPNHGDIWEMFNYSVRGKDLLLHNYPVFKKEFFPDKFSIDIAGSHLGWSYYQLQGFVALQVFFNFLSFDNIYINTLLFSFLMMYGRIAFYRMLCDRYPGREFISLILVFLIPSVLFWTSVVHKEGLLYCALGVLMYCLQKLWGRADLPSHMSAGLRKFQGQRILWTIISLFIIFITRKPLFITLIPALIIWWMYERTGLRKKYILLMVCAGFAGLFIVLGYLNSECSLLHQLGERQQEYFRLKGGSAVFIPALDDSAGSFGAALPYAVLNGLFMPLPGTGGKWIYSLFSLELLAIWIFIIISLVKNKVAWKEKTFIGDGPSTGLFVFAIGFCLIIGYTVPYIGAIVRYRSILYPFLLLPFLAGFNNHTSSESRNKR